MGATVLCHRILVTGAPASGKGWLVDRVRALTGLGDAAVDPGDRQALERAREWVVVTERADDVGRAADLADLIVVMRAPAWLRRVRLLLRRLDPRRPRPSGPSTERWSRDVEPRLRAQLAAHRARVMECASSEDVRAVLERVFGIPASGAS